MVLLVADRLAPLVGRVASTAAAPAARPVVSTGVAPVVEAPVAGVRLVAAVLVEDPVVVPEDSGDADRAVLVSVRGARSGAVVGSKISDPRIFRSSHRRMRPCPKARS